MRGAAGPTTHRDSGSRVVDQPIHLGRVKALINIERDNEHDEHVRRIRAPKAWRQQRRRLKAMVSETTRARSYRKAPAAILPVALSRRRAGLLCVLSVVVGPDGGLGSG